MNAVIVNSSDTLSTLLGDIREAWNRHKYLRVTVKTGKDRSLPQNAITHAWYAQIARELREDSEMGWKCYCKLHHGVPILRLADDEFRGTYDRVIKPLSYENKIEAMKVWPVTSLMTKAQLSEYAESVQRDFHQRGVLLMFPEAA